MHRRRLHHYILIYFTFCIAIMLSILPLPEWAVWFRPAWVAMVLLFWLLRAPQYVGLFTAWTVGLLLDVLTGTVLGEHALVLLLLAFVTDKIVLKMRVYPLWQQALVVGLLIAFLRTILFVLHGLLGARIATPLFWCPAISSMLLWPWLCILLRDLSPQLQVRA